MGFAKILSKLIDNFKANWSEFITNWKDRKHFELNYFKLEQLFAEIRHFVAENDDYESKESIQTNFRINFDPPTFAQALRCILDIEDTIHEVS